MSNRPQASSAAGRSRPPGPAGRAAFNAGKRIKGRKRHIATDTAGNMLDGMVHTADVPCLPRRTPGQAAAYMDMPVLPIADMGFIHV